MFMFYKKLKNHHLKVILGCLLVNLRGKLKGHCGSLLFVLVLSIWRADM